MSCLAIEELNSWFQRNRTELNYEKKKKKKKEKKKNEFYFNGFYQYVYVDVT